MPDSEETMTKILVKFKTSKIMNMPDSEETMTKILVNNVQVSEKV